MYEATIIQIKDIKKHPNADKLQLVSCLGEQIITSMDAKLGDFYVYFPTDGKINPEILYDLKLFRKDPNTGEKWNGFFDTNCRVKTVKILNEKSDGFLLPLETLNSWLKAKGTKPLPIQEDFPITDWDNINICEKFYSAQTEQLIKEGKQQQIKSNNSKYFKKHVDTNQFWKSKWTSATDMFSKLIITEKLHGTSGRFGYLREKVNVPKYLLMFINWILSLFKLPSYKPYIYKHFLGTRNSTLTLDGEHKNYRQKTVESLIGRLKPGEILYYEIVGYKDSGRPLFHHNSKSLKDKEITKQFGESIDYSYGCDSKDPNNLNKIFVYRIVHVNEDSGKQRELTWQEVKERCYELNISHVPDIQSTYVHTAESHIEHHKETFENVYCELDIKESSLDSRHPREGVCIRIEGINTIRFYKIKTFLFKSLEGIVKDDSSYVDEEEIA